ncbi:MAG: DUF4200 domain-containing protein [Proteobacteria bacterium]|nr:DUF4200 domain-containing protein [Pseudomonadota bacterium]
MFWKIVATLLLFLLSSTEFSLADDNKKNLTVQDVKKIVQEEMQAERDKLKVKEEQLNKREKELAERELKLKTEVVNSEAEPKSLVINDKAVTAPGPLSLEISGYGDINANFYDYSESEDQPVGNRGQSKSTFDTERFVMELEAKHQPSEIEIEAEIEFEHGGTGSSQEIEFEEFGEFENEVEKGGEVIIEELYLQKQFGDGYSAKVGRFYLALNTLSYYYLPTDYLGVRRPEVEEVMLPGQWDEIGISLEKELDFGRLTFQVVNGLDSTGFSSSSWIAAGHQSRFEGVRAEDLALVSRIDVNSLYPGLALGAAIYVGNTSGNRPRDDLDVDGGLLIGSANFRYWDKDFKTQGAFYLGHLEDAQEISERNSRLSNALGVERTPVADGALGLWTEFGYNIGQYLSLANNHQLSPFFRFDYYDTNYETRDSLPENGRYERLVYTLGLSYLYDDFLTLKINGSRREFGESNVNSQDVLGLGLGFVY